MIIATRRMRWRVALLATCLALGSLQATACLLYTSRDAAQMDAGPGPAGAWHRYRGMSSFWWT